MRGIRILKVRFFRRQLARGHDKVQERPVARIDAKVRACDPDQDFVFDLIDQFVPIEDIHPESEGSTFQNANPFNSAPRCIQREKAPFLP